MGKLTDNFYPMNKIKSKIQPKSLKSKYVRFIYFGRVFTCLPKDPIFFLFMFFSIKNVQLSGRNERPEIEEIR
jgi:hypothetical protein